MKTSTSGIALLHLLEGNPLTVYVGIDNIPTVGPGLAAHNPIVKEMLGPLKPGTKYPREVLDRVFVAVLDKYTEPAVRNGMPKAAQYEFDAGNSVTYNCGKGAMDWTWAKLWRAGDKDAAADYLGTHYNTSRGKFSRGVDNRRKIEALLLRKGVYTGIDTKDMPEYAPREAIEKKPAAAPDPVVEEVQTILTAKGFNPGAIDGWMGAKTKAAIVAYQSAHPHLVADGVIGAATLTQLRRDAEAGKKVLVDAIGKGGTGAVGSAVSATIAGVPMQWVIIGGVAILLGFAAWALWRRRDVIARRFNTATGKTVAV